MAAKQRLLNKAMQIQVEDRKGYSILHLSNDFDIQDVASLEEHVENLQGKGVLLIVLNVNLMTFINSTGLTAIVRLSRNLRREGGKLAISMPSPFCRRIFEEIGLDRAISICLTDEVAGEELLNARKSHR